MIWLMKCLRKQVAGKSMITNKLSKRYKMIYRVIGCIGLLLLITSIFTDTILIFRGGLDSLSLEQKINHLICFGINFFSIVLFLLIILKPERCEFFALISIIYTFEILIVNVSNLISVFMAILAIVVLVMRGFFIKKKYLKIAILAILYIGALCTEIRFGLVDFITSLLNNIAAFFISAIIFLFIQKYLASITSRYEPRILDLTKYKDLTALDKEIIKLLKEGQKYEWIAGNQGIATSTLKKHVKRIFEILDVADLVEFHAQFGGIEIIYTEEELHEWKKRFLEENHPG